MLWTFTDDRMLHATTSIPWPESVLAEADVAFSTAQPRGVTPPTTDIQRSVRDRDGDLVPPGTRREEAGPSGPASHECLLVAGRMVRPRD